MKELSNINEQNNISSFTCTFDPNNICNGMIYSGIKIFHLI